MKNKGIFWAILFLCFLHKKLAGTSELALLKHDLSAAEKILRDNLRNKNAITTNKAEIQDAFETIFKLSSQLRIVHPTTARSFYSFITKEIGSKAVDNASLLEDIAIYSHLPPNETTIQGIILSLSSLHIINLANQKSPPDEKDIKDSGQSFLDSLKSLKTKRKSPKATSGDARSSLNITSSWHPSQKSINNVLWTIFWIICIGATIFIAALLIQYFFFSSKQKNVPQKQNDLIEKIQEKEEKETKPNDYNQLLVSFETKKKKLETLINTASETCSNLQDGTFLDQFFPISSTNAVVRFFFQASSFMSLNTLSTVLQSTYTAATRHQTNSYDDDISIEDIEEEFKKLKVPHGTIW